MEDKSTHPSIHPGHSQKLPVTTLNAAVKTLRYKNGLQSMNEFLVVWKLTGSGVICVQALCEEFLAQEWVGYLCVLPVYQCVFSGFAWSTDVLEVDSCVCMHACVNYDRLQHRETDKKRKDMRNDLSRKFSGSYLSVEVGGVRGKCFCTVRDWTVWQY